MDEYRAATTKDYVNFGNVQSGQVRKVIYNLLFSMILLIFFRLNKHRNLGMSGRILIDDLNIVRHKSDEENDDNFFPLINIFSYISCFFLI
jgi:hypothetical protein